MMGARLFRVSLPVLAVATALAAGPALAAGAVPPRPGEPVARCFDPVSVVLGAKPHRAPEATARRGGGQAAPSQAAATPADPRPILTLVMERPRDCKGPLDWVSVSAPPQLSGMLDGEPGGGFGAPFQATLAATAQGAVAGDMGRPGPPPRRTPLSPRTPFPPKIPRPADSPSAADSSCRPPRCTALRGERRSERPSRRISASPASPPRRARLRRWPIRRTLCRQPTIRRARPWRRPGSPAFPSPRPGPCWSWACSAWARPCAGAGCPRPWTPRSRAARSKVRRISGSG